MGERSEFRSIDVMQRVKILREADDTIEPMTVPALMKRTAENYANHTALMYKNVESKEWQGITYKEYRGRVEKMAKVFIKLGLERRGTVAVLAFNSVEWFVSEMAAIHAGGIIAGIYSTNSSEACLHILESSKANIVVVDEEKQLDKIREIQHKLPHLKAIIKTMPSTGVLKETDGFYHWREAEAMSTDDVEDEYQKRHSSIEANECCFLIYTSGTVGLPKGVMLSHDNLTYDVYAIDQRFKFHHGQERFVSYLPLSHVAAQMAEVFMPLYLAGTVYFADKDALRGTLTQTLVKARPTFFIGVPRVYEKIQEKMAEVGANSSKVKQLIGAWAKHVTLKHRMNQMRGLELGSLQLKLAEKLVISKVKTALGFQSCRYFTSGAAPLSVEIKKYFLSLDMKIMDAYGLSETTGAHCCCPLTYHTFETIGKPLLGMTTKVINPDEKGHGELCYKGRHVFMGYLNDPEKTAETFDGNWFKSGDCGYIDRDGFLFITGRLKELIITAGGENIPPVLIENVVKSECPAISNAFLVGDKRKFLTMLLTLKTEMNSEGAPLDDLTFETLKWIEGMNLKYRKLSEILAAGPDPKVLQAIQKAIDRANEKSVSNAQKIQKFAILSQDFSLPTGEVGPSLKIKRNVVIEKNIKIIEKFYK